MTRLTDIFAKAAVVLVAAFTVCACADEPYGQAELRRQAQAQQGQQADSAGTNARVVHFYATPLHTKAAFGPEEDGIRPTLWTANDDALKLSLNLGGAITAGVTPSDDYRTASFSASVDFGTSSAPYVFYAVSPASAAVSLSPSREAWKVNIPAEQTPSQLSVDEGAIIIASSSAQFSDAATIDEVDLQFYHLTAYGRMSLGNLALADGESLRQVELSMTTPIVGDWYWKCEASSGEHELLDYGASSTLTINTTSASDIWFGCVPVDVSGQMMVVRAYTNLGMWERYVEFPQGRKFTAGQVAVFGVNMASAEFKPYGSGSGDFTLVTDASTLSAGDEIIIANTDGDKALGSNTGSYREAVDITSNGCEITDAGQAVVLKLEAGSSSGTWAFKAGDGYLATSSSKNSLTVSNAVGATSSWSVSIVGGDATVVAQSGTYNHLCYNSGAPRFSGYKSTSNMAAVAIYRRSGSATTPEPGADALLAKSVYGCYLGGGLDWEYNPGSDQISRSYSADGTLTFTLINPEGVEELEITGYKSGYIKGDQVTLIVNWRRGTRSVLSQSYKMTIIREDGPKLWLSDGAGKGFIIKK